MCGTWYLFGFSISKSDVWYLALLGFSIRKSYVWYLEVVVVVVVATQLRFQAS